MLDKIYLAKVIGLQIMGIFAIVSQINSVPMIKPQKYEGTKRSHAFFILKLYIVTIGFYT